MYSTKGVGPGMEPQGATTLTGYCPKDFAPRTNQNHLLQWNDEISLDTRPERFEFVKKISMPNHVESLGYVMCYSSNSPITFQTPSNYIRWNCYKSCSWKGRPETTLKVRKRASSWNDQQDFANFAGILLNTKRKLTRKKFEVNSSSAVEFTFPNNWLLLIFLQYTV